MASAQAVRAVRWVAVVAACSAVACGSSSGGSAAPDGGTGNHDAASPGDGASASSSGGGSSGGHDSGSAGDSGGSLEGGANPDSGSKGEGGAGPEGGPGASGLWVMGYYASWHDPANGGNYPVTAIDWDGLTHVAAAFYLPDGKGGWDTGSFDQGTATTLIAAAHAHGKKAIASIGGAGSGPVFEGSTSAANLTTFVGNLEALITLGYDGIDIDWEGGNMTAAQDQTLQSSLVQALRTQSPNIVLTLTAGYENENLLDDLSWYGTIAAQLDQMNLMTYGMAGAYQGWQSWHASPLHWNSVSSTPTGIDASVGHYLAANVPAAKLGIGIGFYGLCYTSPVTAPVQALGASTVVASDGTMSYPNILASYYSASAYHYDAAAEAPYLTLGGSNAEKCTYVSYEDPTSIAAKGAWAKGKGLGGVILWEIGEGYVPSGATVQAQNPLLEAVKAGFLP
ncbi:MAG TPA: glycoside hydrolase family 18 protein [Polyangiaceae bacterium]|jgi:chitinase